VVITPRDAARRGCQLSLLFKQNVRSVCEYLEHHGVVCDMREPDVIRFSPVPLYNTFADVLRCVQALKSAMTK